MEQEVFEELNKAFPEEDVLILKQISKRREKLRKSLGPFYTKLGKKNKKKVDKKDEELFDKLSEDSQSIYSKLNQNFKNNLDKSLSSLKGSIYYV